jgi:cytidyltransferase-like protein
MAKYQLIASGTFDHLHKGHKSFLEKSFEISDEVIVCITSARYVKSFRDARKIEDFEIRKKNVARFLESIGKINKAIIIPIDDMYGPLLTNRFNPQGIAVTPENKERAEKINKKRVEIGFPELEIKLVQMSLAEDGNIISATRIRNGEINRDGRLYLNPKWKNKKLNLPENLRLSLQQPWGEIVGDVPEDVDGSKTITIGDIVTQTFNHKKIGQFLSIIDFVVQRQIKFHDLSELCFTHRNIEKTRNPHGTITPELFEAVGKAFKTKDEKIILVEGEEDLAVLPVLLVAPLGFSIFYGQPNVGMVQVLVTEENKEKAYRIISQFKIFS